MTSAAVEASATADLAGRTAAVKAAGKRGGALVPDRAPYSAARPIYAPTPVNPLYISGYAGRSRPAPPARVVVPIAPGRESEPALLP